MQIIALVVFFMLATSSVSAVAITQQDPLDENLQKNSDIIFPEKMQSQVIESYDVRVSDGFNLGDIDTQQEKILVKDKPSQVIHRVDIRVEEKLGVGDYDDFAKSMQIQKQISDRKTIMEKIWNAERIRFTGKSFVVEDQFGKQNESLIDESYELTDQSLSELALDYYPTRNLPTLSSYLFQQHASQIPIVLVDANGSSVVTFEDISKVIGQGVDSFNDFASLNSPAVLLLLVPIAGYIFVRSENDEFKFYSFRKFSSFVLALVLLSSIVTFPLSVSISYGLNAYADSDPLISDDYVTFATDLPNELQALTVSAWVKPDYSGGSPEFTVVSKDKAFVLSINKLISPEKVAKFSIFDGIKWHTVESTSQIDERLTHLAATFGNSSISIYVNGKLESTLSDIEIMSLNDKGNLVMSPLGSISSDSDVILGAYTTIRNDQLKVTNQFSGLYNNIQLFDFAADQSQIDEMYIGAFDVQEFTDVVITSDSTTDRGPIPEFDEGVVITSSGTTDTGSIGNNFEWNYRHKLSTRIW